MKKQLLSIDNLDEYISKQNGKTLYADSSLIITPGAKDELKRRGIEIIYNNTCSSNSAFGGCPPGCNCGVCAAISALSANPENERLFYAIAATLKDEYKITNDEELKNLSLQFVRTLKENL